MRKLIVTAAAILAAALISVPASAQSADSIYVTPASGSYPIGTSFTVSVRENTSTQVNAVQADLAYSSNIQFVSIDASGSAFGIDASSTGGGGVVSMSRGTIVPVSGDKLVAKVTFKVVSGGTATISMQDSSVVLSSSTNTDVIKSRKGSSFDAQQGGATPNPTPTPVVTTPEPSPAGGNGGGSGSSGGVTRGSLPVNTIAPLGSGQSSAMPGDSVVELEAPATIVTTPDVNRKVMKVEYLLNGKLLATDDSPPYSYTLDTTQYRNGEYTFTTRTYYQDGAPDISNSTIVVKNKLTPYQLWLHVVHYAWLIVIVLIIIAEVLYLKFFRRKRHQRPPSGPMPGAGRFGGPPAGGPGFSQPGAQPQRPPAMTTQPSAAPAASQAPMAGSVQPAPVAQPVPGASGQTGSPASQSAAPSPGVTPSQQNQGQNV